VPIIFFKKKIKFILINIILLALFTLNNVFGNEILLKKGSIIITNDDLNNYIDIYKSYYKTNITEGTAIKNIFIIFKTIDHQIKNNSNFKKITEKMMLEDITKFKDIFDSYILKYFLRFEILKNDYIQNYISNFDINKLKVDMKEKIFFFQTQDCKIIRYTKKYEKLNKVEKKSLFNKGNNTIIKIKNDNYICLNDNNIKEINNIIINTISQDGYSSFLNYAYKKIK